MQKPDKAPEPSMEEILASIRKIIAEEPIGTRPGPEPRGPSLGSLSSQPDAGKPSDRSDGPKFTRPSRDDRGSDGPPFSVDDALADLIDDPPLPRFATGPGRDDAIPKPPVRPAAPEEDNQRPSWLFARPGASAAQPAPDPSAESPRGPGLLGQLDSIRPLPRSGPGSGIEPLTPKPAAGPQKIPAPDSPVDRQVETVRPTGGVTPIPLGHQPQDPVLPGAARNTPTGIGSAPPRAEGGPSPAAPAGVVNRPEPTPQQPASRVAEPPRDAGAAPAAAKPQPVEPATRVEQPRPVQPRADAPAVESKPAPAPVPERPARTDASPLATLAQSLAASSASPAPSQEAAKVEPAPAPKTEAPASSPVVRTLEDTVAELLRPMLRDWLDANMPRIVEKALRVELATSAKRPTAGGDAAKM